jgi:hypothetical protein
VLFHGVLADNHIEGVFTRKLNGGINTLSDTGVSSFNLGYGFAFSMNSADDAAFIGLQHSCASRRPGVERVQLQRNEVLSTIARLLFMLLRLAGVRLDETRIPDGAAKEKILTAIARARTTLQFAVVLRVLGLSPSRYHAWNRLERACQLDDRSSCPRTTPTQLTAEEVRTMHDLATSGC